MTVFIASYIPFNLANIVGTISANGRGSSGKGKSTFKSKLRNPYNPAIDVLLQNKQCAVVLTIGCEKIGERIEAEYSLDENTHVLPDEVSDF